MTDHKPLLGLLKEDKATSVHASARIKRWSFLSSYGYTEAHANADALSRLPLPITLTKVEVEPELVLLMDQLQESPVSAADIKTWTRRDPKLSRVFKYVQRGWPSDVICNKATGTVNT